jgi:hypothetical protein
MTAIAESSYLFLNYVLRESISAAKSAADLYFRPLYSTLNSRELRSRWNGQNAAQKAAFKPSDRLAGILFEGLKAYSDILGEPLTNDREKVLRLQAEEILAPRVIETIASYARQLRTTRKAPAPLISSEGVFDYAFVLELQSNIPFRIDRSNPSFFEQLSKELASFLARGGMIAGRWGKLLLHNGAVEFDLAAEGISSEDSTWEKPTRVEWN